MTLAKATVTGTVFRAPEKRYTQNDIAIYGLTLNIDEREETLIRVISKRKSLSDVLDRVKVGDKILVDGRLQIATTKANDGSDRKYFEIDANDVELLGASNGSVPVSSSASESAPAAAPKEDIVTFAETDFSEDSLMDADEIPF
jgi:single-stranded DNA-binding protein